MKKSVWIVIAICLSEIVLADIVINEIMYNPEGNDNNKEFVEIYSEDYINLSGFIIADSDSNDSLIEEKYFDSGYALIVEGGFDYSDISASIYSVGATIGNNLNNDGDSIILFDANGTVIDSVDYSDSWGADGDGYTLERIDPEESDWTVGLVANGTPGYENSVYGIEDEPIDYSVIEISEFLPNPEGDDDAGMPDGEWIELYNPTDNEMNLKWMFFKDLAGHELYITDTTVEDETIIPANGYLVVYTNGKSGFLNNDGQESLLFYDKDESLIDNVSYIDPVEGNSYAFVDGFWQSTMPTPGEDNINYSDVSESRFEIEKIYDLGSDNKAKFGQTIRAKVNIWKGDDTKNSISLWVEDDEHRVSKYSKTNVYTKYTEYDLALPVQIYPNCDEDYDEGNYTLYLGWTSGYEIKDSYDIYIEGISKDVCVGKKKKQKAVKKFIYELVSKPDEIEVGKRFDIEVKLTNNDNSANEIEIWSYVYRGNKAYSGDREENKKSLTVHAKESEIVKLSNIVQEAEPGSYKLKVRIRKDDQKTFKEITEVVEITGNDAEEEKCIVQGVVEEAGYVDEKKELSSRNTRISVYESSSIKMKNLISYFIIGMFGLLVVILIWKK